MIFYLTLIDNLLKVNIDTFATVNDGMIFVIKLSH